MVESRSTLHAPAETSTFGRSPAETYLHQHREALLARLIFSARSLAEAQLASGNFERRGQRVCTECRIWEQLGERHHTAHCRTGRVLGILDDLANLNLPAERSSARDISFPAAAVEERPRVEAVTFNGLIAAIDDLFVKYVFVPIGIDPIVADTEGGMH